MAQLAKTDEAAKFSYERWNTHSWYLDPTVVPFILADDTMSIKSHEREAIARRPQVSDFERKNNTGMLPDISVLSGLQGPPSLADYVTCGSWLIFEILDHDRVKCKWMLLPQNCWHHDQDYLHFKKFVEETAVVNDASERAVKLVQETVMQAISEIKLQKILVVKSKLAKPSSRTKKAYQEAAEVLTPSEQLDLVFGLSACCNFLHCVCKICKSSCSANPTLVFSENKLFFKNA